MTEQAQRQVLENLRRIDWIAAAVGTELPDDDNRADVIKIMTFTHKTIAQIEQQPKEKE